MYSLVLFSFFYCCNRTEKCFFVFIPLVVTSDVTGYAVVVDSSAVDVTAKTDNCNYIKKRNDQIINQKTFQQALFIFVFLFCSNKILRKSTPDERL